MNIDVSKLTNAVVPEAAGRNVRIISDNMTGSSNRDPNFLSGDFPHSPCKLYFTAESDEFDAGTLEEWRNEGFNVEYFPMGNGGEEYYQRLAALSRQTTGAFESFGIIAYGDAAALCLQHYHIMDNNPDSKLRLLIAYYPTSIPDPKGRFPTSITTLVHLIEGEDVGVVKQSQMLGIQGKKRTARRTIQGGAGTGGLLHLAYPSYTYKAEAGFAEYDLEEYDRISAELAWSRSLATARRALNMNTDSETVLEKNLQGKFFSRNLQPILSTYTTNKPPYVLYSPTLAGGSSVAELEKFYADFFGNPTSLDITLISRTIGTDRIVDEMHVQFKHTEDMPWILSNVPPTNKNVQIIIVSIVALRGGKLYHEHVYWDQASVLAQIGALDPNLVPEAARKIGIEKLPIVGAEAAARVLGRK